MSVSFIHKILVNPLFVGIVGSAFLILSEKLHEKKIFDLNWNPLTYIGLVLTGYFFLAIAVFLSSDVIWLFFCFAGLLLALISTGETLLIGLAFIVLNVTFFFNHQIVSFMFPR